MAAILCASHSYCQYPTHSFVVQFMRMTESRGDRLRQTRKTKYKSAAAAARAIGIPYATYVSHENGSRDIEVEPGQRYAAFFGINLEWLLSGKGSARKSKSSYTTEPAEGIPIRGIAKAGIWQEHDVDQYLESDDPVVFMSGPRPKDVFALKVEGNSMNQIVKDGEFAICAEFASYGKELANDDVVFVERRRAGLTEHSLKAVVRKNGRTILEPRSTDPKFQKAIDLDAPEEDTEIAIIGIYLGKFTAAKTT